MGFGDGGASTGVDADAEVDAEADAEGDAEVDADADALTELGLGVPDGADEPQSSTVTVQVAFADPMLR